MKKDKIAEEGAPAIGERAGLSRVEVPGEAGEFSHQLEEAESPCVTPRPEPVCQCGTYELTWASGSPVS